MGIETARICSCFVCNVFNYQIKKFEDTCNKMFKLSYKKALLIFKFALYVPTSYSIILLKLVNEDVLNITLACNNTKKFTWLIFLFNRNLCNSKGFNILKFITWKKNNITMFTLFCSIFTVEGEIVTK